MIYIDDRINDFDLTAALQQLSAQRREQALRFRYELGQRTCALAYLLLKRALSEEYGITENPVFEYGEHGKPAIVGHPEIFFNLSHCRDRPVGIDVESIRSFKESLVRFTMNEQEVERIMAAERPEVAFIRLWTMKEARLKLTGEGISNDLKTVLKEHPQFRFTTHEAPTYIYTVCE